MAKVVVAGIATSKDLIAPRKFCVNVLPKVKFPRRNLKAEAPCWKAKKWNSNKICLERKNQSLGSDFFIYAPFTFSHFSDTIFN